MTTFQPTTPTVVSEEARGHGDEMMPIEFAALGENMTFQEMEAMYKRPGGTLAAALFGADPFDFWLGRFYVGTFGIMSMIGIIIGTLGYFYQVIIVEGQWNLLRGRLDPPPISAGLRIVSPNEPGFLWQVIMIAATIAFIGWMLRQVDISRKLGMSYEIPIAYGAVVSSWITLQWLRPIAMGAWGNGFALGITHHLDWVSNIGYQYYNFFYNPFHAVGVSLLFGSTLVLAMHGSAILSGVNRTEIREAHVDGFWRNIVGYSIGEIGIHRAAFWVAISSVLFANICIFLSGTAVFSWVKFWDWWNDLILWSSAGVMGTAAIGMTVWRGNPLRRRVSVDELEYGGSGLESTAGEPMHVPLLGRLFGNDQVFPVYLGLPGLIAVVTGGMSAFIIVESMLYSVGYNAILFTRSFFTLSLEPPINSYGLTLAPWRAGGAWIFATLLMTVAIFAWWARLYTRAKAAGLKPVLAQAFIPAILLYLVIYIIRPIVIGNWAQAPGQGFAAVLNWTNNMNVLYGNFYYNPLHMISIFFLLGSVVLLAMHGATIVAASSYGAHRELEEMMSEGTGTHRAQLFWRWTMGFNVNSKTIHNWAFWFAAMVAITGAIGLMMTGTIVDDWFSWAQNAGIVAPLP